jgi:hypothetical protein
MRWRDSRKAGRVLTPNMVGVEALNEVSQIDLWVESVFAIGTTSPV